MLGLGRAEPNFVILYGPNGVRTPILRQCGYSQMLVWKGLSAQVSKSEALRPCMCNTSNPTKSQTVDFDFGIGELLRTIITQKHVLSLFHSLSPSARKETEAHKLFLKVCCKSPFLYFSATASSFQVLHYFKYFPK